MDKRTVFNTIKAHEYHGPIIDPDSDDRRNMAQLEMAWMMFKAGKASSEQQKMVYFIHQYLMENKPKKEPLIHRNFRIRHLIESLNMNVAEACKWAAKGRGGNPDSYARKYRQWMEETSQEERDEQFKECLKFNYINPFV